MPPARVEQTLHIDGERIVDQLDHLVPQIHLTLASVLQGIALVYLITSLAKTPPSGFDLTTIDEALVRHHFYLPHVASFLVIIIVWNQLAYATFFYHWPLTATMTVLQFLLAVTEIATFSTVDAIGLWTFWMGTLAIVASLIYLRNRQVTNVNLFPSQELADRFSDSGGRMRLYGSFGILLPLLGIARERGILGLGGHLLQIPFDIIVPAAVVFLGLYLLRTDSSAFAAGVRDLLATSSPQVYTLGRGGRIAVFDQQQTAAEQAKPQHGRYALGLHSLPFLTGFRGHEPARILETRRKQTQAESGADDMT